MADHSDLGYITIDELPDDVLLEIFDFCMCRVEAWEALVHVCLRWQYIVSAASRRLELRPICTTGTPAGEKLDIWPKLPIVIRVSGIERWDRQCHYSSQTS